MYNSVSRGQVVVQYSVPWLHVCLCRISDCIARLVCVLELAFFRLRLSHAFLKGLVGAVAAAATAFFVHICEVEIAVTCVSRLKRMLRWCVGVLSLYFCRSLVPPVIERRLLNWRVSCNRG